MRRSSWHPALVLTSLFALTLLLTGCPKRPMVPVASAPPPTAPTPAPAAAALAPAPPVTVAPTPAEPPALTPAPPKEYAPNPALAAIHFDFDREWEE